MKNKDNFHKVKILKASDKEENNTSNCSYKYLFIFLISIIIILLIIIFIISYNKNLNNNELNIDLDNLDKFEVNIYKNIENIIEKNKCSIMWKNQREFLNGIVRKFRPKKIVEIGVANGGSSSIILNAIQDIPNSHLYSIDIEDINKIGKCVYNYFSKLKRKWTLFKGNIAAKFLEKIGKDIDMVFFDSSHFEPGELLDFLMVLPFLKEEAIVSFHDIGNQINFSGEKDTRHEWVPYIIFNLIRGKKFYPSGDNILLKDIGAIKLEKNQKNFIYDYFRALGGQWEYFLKEEYINLMRDLIKKYYDEICLSIFDEAIKFNRYFVKNNPKENYYLSKVFKNKYKYKLFKKIKKI